MSIQLDGREVTITGREAPGYVGAESGITYPSGLVWVRDGYGNEVGVSPAGLVTVA